MKLEEIVPLLKQIYVNGITVYDILHIQLIEKDISDIFSDSSESIIQVNTLKD